MKTKHLISLLVGITFVALVPGTWAAGHGGGGGGGGGHAGGGGVARGGSVGFGVGSRGGGVGFGGARFSGGVPHFPGAGPRFSSFGHPSYRQPAYSGLAGRSGTSAFPRQTGVTQRQSRFS